MIVTSILRTRLATVCPVDGVAGPFTAVTFPVSPAADGSLWRIDFNIAATSTQQTAARNLLATLNPAAMATAQPTYDAAVAAGLSLTWTVSTALNDTYALDDISLLMMLTERVCFGFNNVFIDGTTTLQWPGVTGVVHVFTAAQANTFARAVWAYLTALKRAYSAAISGGTPSWPSPHVTVTG